MEETEHLSALIGDIYDAALDPGLWCETLAGCTQFVGGSAAAIYAKYPASKSGNIYYDDGGLEPRYVTLYFNKYVKLDPVTTGHYFSEIGEPTATADIMPYEEFLETRFYREWVRPQRLVDHLTAVLERSPASAALFGVFRHERDGIVNGETRRRMRLIVPHVRRAVLIGRVLDLSDGKAAALTDALDGLSAGMFLVDNDRRIQHANQAGHAMLAAGEFIKADGGRLRVCDPQADQTLGDIFAAVGGDDLSLGARGIGMAFTTGSKEHHVAHILPLTAGRRRRTGVEYGAAAAVFVHKAALDVPSPPEVIAKTFHLTPTELRVLLAIVEVGGVPETAEALGVAGSTVKTHLGRVFEKTDTRRQADLVKIVAGFSNPLVT